MGFVGHRGPEPAELQGGASSLHQGRASAILELQPSPKVPVGYTHTHWVHLPPLLLLIKQQTQKLVLLQPVSRGRQTLLESSFVQAEPSAGSDSIAELAEAEPALAEARPALIHQWEGPSL